MPGIVKGVGMEVKRLMEAQHLALFHINEHVANERKFHGTLYVNDQNDCFDSIKYTADPYLTKTLELKKSFVLTHPSGLEMNGVKIKQCLLSPLIDPQVTFISCRHSC